MQDAIAVLLLGEAVAMFLAVLAIAISASVATAARDLQRKVEYLESIVNDLRDRDAHADRDSIDDADRWKYGLRPRHYEDEP